MKVLFPDTNLFLQCKPIEQLPWEEISGDDILVLISRPLQAEIDELKQSGSSRKAQRARTATSLFRRILKGDNIVMKEDKPHVAIAFSPHVNQDNFGDYNLNPSRPDDQIAFEALIYRENHEERDVALLTHDTGIAVTAKSVGLPYVIIPDEWLLPPETDSRDKRIKELELRVKELEKTHPQIEIKCLDTDHKAIDSLSVKLPKYWPITESQIRSIMETIRTRFPLTTDSNNQTNALPSYITDLGIAEFTRPSKQRIDKYTNEDYPKWLEEIERILTTLNTKLDLKFRNARFFISISNIGNVPAENATFDFILHKGLLIPPPSEFVDDKEAPQNISLALPNPPAAPKARRSTAGISSFPFSQLPSAGVSSRPFIKLDKERDRHSFYWKPNRPIKMTDKWTLECDEFRHQMPAKTFEVLVHFSPEFIDRKAALAVIVGAKNLPKPIKSVFTIEIEHITKDASECAYSLIDDVKSK
jgi:hypothetical protein